MIDITGLREDKRPQSSAIVHALLDRLEAAEKERDGLRESEKWYRRRCDLLQEQQSKMRDPERTIVCDILANGGQAMTALDSTRSAAVDHAYHWQPMATCPKGSKVQLPTRAPGEGK